MSYRSPAERAAEVSNGTRDAPVYAANPHATTAPASSLAPQINIRYHRSAHDATARPDGVGASRLPPTHLSISAGATLLSPGQTYLHLQPSALHTSSSSPLSLAHHLSAATSPSSSPHSSTSVSPGVSVSLQYPASSFPAPASRVRPRPRSRPYQSLLKYASAEEASASEDESRWLEANVQTTQADLPPYALMHGSTYMSSAHGVSQPYSSPPNYSSSSASNSPVIPPPLSQPNPPSIVQPIAPSERQPQHQPQSRSRSNSVTSAASTIASTQLGASLSSPPLSVHSLISARGNALPGEQNAVNSLLASARSMWETLAFPRQSPNSSPSANHQPPPSYSYQPGVAPSSRPPSTISPSASPLVLSHYSSTFPPPPLASSMHSSLPPIHDDDDALESDDDDSELQALTEDSDLSSDDEYDDAPTTARHDKYGRQRSRNVRVIRVRCPSFRSCHQRSKSWSWERCQTSCSNVCCFIVSPDLWLSALSSVPWVKNVLNRYKELPWSTREKLMFVLSSTLGTVLFLFLFESFMIVNTYDLEDGSQGAFTVSYLLAYVISIAWQHALHRLLVFQSQPYCLSLLHTYLSYSFSLAVMALLGTFLIERMHISARVVACVTLPCSAIANYYLLRGCITMSERWQQAQTAAAAQHNSAIARPFFVPNPQQPYAYIQNQYPHHQQQQQPQQQPQQLNEYYNVEHSTPHAAHPPPYTPSTPDTSTDAVEVDGLSPMSASTTELVYAPYRHPFPSHSQNSPTASALVFHSRVI